MNSSLSYKILLLVGVIALGAAGCQKGEEQPANDQMNVQGGGAIGAGDGAPVAGETNADAASDGGSLADGGAPVAGNETGNTAQ